jgi:hypothetical protein
MVEPATLSIAGTVVSELLKWVMQATKVALSCNKYCKVLHTLLEELQPIMDHFVHQVSQSNHGYAYTNSWTAMNIQLDNLKGTFKKLLEQVGLDVVVI